MAIGNRILDLILDHDITQKDLAEKLGIAPATLNGYIKNRREPDCKTIVKIADFFNVTCDFLLENYSGSSNLDKLNPYLVGNEKLLLSNFKKIDKKNQDILLSISTIMAEKEMEG